MIKWSNDWQQQLPNKNHTIKVKSPYLNNLTNTVIVQVFPEFL